MKSLHALYLLERENIETVENEKYFFTYRMVEDEFHIITVFIHPKFRSSKVSDDLQLHIQTEAKIKGAKQFFGFLWQNVEGNSRSLAYQVKHGMRLHSWDNEKIVFCKEVQ